MGIELRRVPAWWEHPTDHDYSRRASELAFRPPAHEKWVPVYDEHWGAAWRRVFVDHIRDRLHVLVVRALAILEVRQSPWWRLSWGDSWEAPDPRSYRPKWKKRDATHYQLYETVSEGTPISPVCASIAELVEWCAVHPNVWVGTEGMTRDAWVRFFERGGWAMSGVVENGQFKTGVAFMSQERAPFSTTGPITSVSGQAEE